MKRKQTSNKETPNATKSVGRELALPAAHEPDAMGAPALPQPARDHRAGDVHAARPLAQLRQTALPAGAAVPVPASLLLESQAANVGGGAGAGEEALRAAVEVDGHRFEQGFGRTVAVLRGRDRGRNDTSPLPGGERSRA